MTIVTLITHSTTLSQPNEHMNLAVQHCMHRATADELVRLLTSHCSANSMVISDSAAAQFDITGNIANKKRSACRQPSPSSIGNYANYATLDSASDDRSIAANEHYPSSDAPACGETANSQSNNHKTAAALGDQQQCIKWQTAVISQRETDGEMKKFVARPKTYKAEGHLPVHCAPDVIGQLTDDDASSSSSSQKSIPCSSSCLSSKGLLRRAEQLSSTASMSQSTAPELPPMSFTARLPVSLSGWSATVKLRPMPPLSSIGAYVTSTARQQAAAAYDFMMKLQWLFDEVALTMSPELTSVAHYRPPAIVISANVAIQCDCEDIEQSTRDATACNSIANPINAPTSRVCYGPSDAVTELATKSTSDQPPTCQPQRCFDDNEMTSVSAFISEADQRINEMASLSAMISDTQRASLSAIIREADRRIRELASTGKDGEINCTVDQVFDIHLFFFYMHNFQSTFVCNNYTYLFSLSVTFRHEELHDKQLPFYYFKYILVFTSQRAFVHDVS